MPKCHFNKVANLRIWSHLLKKFLMENFIFCAVIFKKDNKKRLKKI